MHKQNQSVTDRRAEGVQLGQRAAIYARVSTTDQSCERQIVELSAFADRSGFEVLGIFKETASGARNNRLARNRVLQLAQARRIDAVLVTELSRWGRSTQDLLDTLYKLAGWKVSVAAMNGMTFELNKPHGRMMATMLAGIAQFERDLLSECVKSGLAAFSGDRTVRSRSRPLPLTSPFLSNFHPLAPARCGIADLGVANLGVVAQ